MIGPELQFDHYISRTIHEMTNSELLERISEAVYELLDELDDGLSMRLDL